MRRTQKSRWASRTPWKAGVTDVIQESLQPVVWTFVLFKTYRFIFCLLFSSPPLRYYAVFSKISCLILYCPNAVPVFQKVMLFSFSYVGLPISSGGLYEIICIRPVMPVDCRERWEVCLRRVWFGTRLWYRKRWWSVGEVRFTLSQARIP